MIRQADTIIKVSRQAYEREAVLSAAYNIIDGCYLLIDHDGAEYFSVQLWRKNDAAMGAAELESLFLDELLNESLRLRISAENLKIREMIINKALYSASGSAVIPAPVQGQQEGEGDLDLSDFDLDEDDLDFLDDPLGIAVPWEEKYGRQSSDDAAAAAAQEDAPAELSASESGASDDEAPVAKVGVDGGGDE